MLESQRRNTGTRKWTCQTSRTPTLHRRSISATEYCDSSPQLHPLPHSIPPPERRLSSRYSVETPLPAIRIFLEVRRLHSDYSFSGGSSRHFDSMDRPLNTRHFRSFSALDHSFRRRCASPRLSPAFKSSHAPPTTRCAICTQRIEPCPGFDLPFAHMCRECGNPPLLRTTLFCPLKKRAYHPHSFLHRQ